MSARTPTGLRAESARTQFSLVRAPALPRPVPALPVPFLKGGGSKDAARDLPATTSQNHLRSVEGDAA